MIRQLPFHMSSFNYDIQSGSLNNTDIFNTFIDLIVHILEVNVGFKYKRVDMD